MHLFVLLTNFTYSLPLTHLKKILIQIYYSPTIKKLEVQWRGYAQKLQYKQPIQVDTQTQGVPQAWRKVQILQIVGWLGVLAREIFQEELMLELYLKAEYGFSIWIR